MKKRTGTDYIQSFGGYNYLRYKVQPIVSLPSGTRAAVKRTPEYKEALARAEAIDKKRSAPTRIAKKKTAAPAGTTVHDAVFFFYEGPNWKALKPRTQALWRVYLNAWRMQYGEVAIYDLTREDLRGMLRNRLNASGPGAARNWLNAVRGLMRDRIEAGLMKEDANPCMGLKGPILANRHGFATWEPEHMNMYREYWPSGTPQRLAFEMLYHTGAACCDVIRLTNGHIVDGLIEFKREKTGVDSFPRLMPELAAEIAACGLDGTVGALVRTESGLPFKAPQYFSHQFRRWCKQAGIPAGYTAHGVRKRAATDAAEHDEWTTTQLKAKFGWKTSSQVDPYTQAAEMRRVARRSVNKPRSA